MTIAAQLVAEARTYMGVRWLHQGRTRAGIDCVGLVVEVAKTVIGWTQDVTDYGRQATDESMLNFCRAHLTEVRRSRLQAGDVVVFAFDNQRHMAIFTGPELYSIVHAYLPNRGVVEQRLDDSWLARVVGCFRFREVDA